LPPLVLATVALGVPPYPTSEAHDGVEDAAAWADPGTRTKVLPTTTATAPRTRLNVVASWPHWPPVVSLRNTVT